MCVCDTRLSKQISFTAVVSSRLAKLEIFQVPTSGVQFLFITSATDFVLCVDGV